MSGVVRSVLIRIAVDGSQAVRGTKQVGDEIERTAQRAKRSGRDLSAANDSIGRGARNTFVAGAAGLAVIEQANIRFDKAMSAVNANLHTSEANIKRLRSAAIEAGADTQFSATEAAQGINELGKSGVSVRDILGGGLKGALDLAAAGQISVADASEAAASALTQFKLQGRDVPHVADLLAAGAGKAQGSVDDLSQALNQSGLVASQTGLSIEDTVGTLTAFAKAGLLGSDAGTSFKTMLLSLNPRSAEAAALMKKYNLQAYDAQGNFIGIAKYAGKLRNGLKGLNQEQRAAALQTIFGTDAIRAANILYRNGEKGISGWTKKVNDQGYAAETAAKQTDNLAGDLERVKGSLESAFINGGSGAQNGLRDVVQEVEHLIDTFNDLPASVQGNVVKAVAALTGLSAGIAVVSKIASPLLKAASFARGSKAGSTAAQLVGGGVQKVFVTNPGFGGPDGPSGPGRGAPVVAPVGKPSLGSRAKSGAKTAGVAALEVYAFAAINEQIQDALRNVGSKGNRGGILSSFKRDKSAINSALFGSGNTLAHDAKYAARQDGVASKIEQFGGKLVGGTSYTKALSNFRELDTALAKLNFTDPGRAAVEFDRVLDEAGLSTKELNKALPKTAEAMASLKDHTNNGAAAFRAVKGVLDTASPLVGKYGKVLRTIPKDVRSRFSTPGSITSVAEATKLARQYKLTPKQIRTTMALNGFSKTQAEIVVAGKNYRSLPKGVKTAISSPGAIKSAADVRALQKRYSLTPAQKRTVMQVSGVAQGIADVRRLQAAIAAVNSKTVTIRTIRTSSGPISTIRGPVSGNSGDRGMLWHGGVRHYARGDVANRHAPELAGPGNVRIWREPETQGEAYIPLANDDRRPRARAIASETVRLLGGTAHFAAGGITSAVSGSSTGTSAVTVVFPTPAVLASAVSAANAIAAAAARTAASTSLTKADVTTTAVTYRDIKANQLDTLHAQQRVRDITLELKKTEAVRVRGRDGRDDDPRRKGIQDRYKTVRRAAVRGLDRTTAYAELNSAKLELADTRKALAAAAAAEAKTNADAVAEAAKTNAAALAEAAKTAIDALNDARQAGAKALTSNGGVFARGSSPASAITSVNRDIANITAYGQVITGLRGKKASASLLAAVQEKAESGDFRSATRLGQALLAQPALFAQLNTALNTRDQVAASIANVTTDPRFLTTAAWNPMGQVASSKSVDVNIGVDPSTFMTELVARVKYEVVQAIAGGT